MAKKQKADTELRRDFALRLKVVRRAAGYANKKDFADALGMEEAETYRRWERGETEPGIGHLRRIADLTGASLDFLIRGKIAESAPPKTNGDARPFKKRPASSS